MPLITLEDFYPTYREGHSDSKSEIKGFEACTQTGNKVGTIADILVDDQAGRFRYLVVDLGLSGSNKKVLLPIGLAHINYTDDRVYVDGLSREQIEHLPELNNLEWIDHHYEEQVRDVYRPVAKTTQKAVTPSVHHYEQDPDLYAVNDTQHQSLKLYEERLIANKQRQKTGEVAIGKHVETETARVSVPVEKERVVIERVAPVSETTIPLGATVFQEGEVARMEVYEETPDVHKEAFVREEVRVTKVVDQDTVMAEETLRREELDVDTQGHPVIDQER
ncbi:DUF2382 domain-containing protein [Phormidesmis priestleyi ULC007]|uniref:DUF2382 domain-containing protein n=1 Tax=Phormidesmis priestleyi ULC007 TaxID=1920490 RepID=A0A2T1DBQ6_9CYAN|nr:DUF2382 domain-containing protein [Phormidesmis priestleyi]PSB17915.1 DUF2382 domain-containing protein [Phormidesmis priestleyi ULC007]PZO53916.1 MAG: DUF2382 domain-containing protein [Phormidesmis priestleyi]